MSGGKKSHQPAYNKVEIYKRERNINGDYIELWLTLYIVGRIRMAGMS